MSLITKQVGDYTLKAGELGDPSFPGLWLDIMDKDDKVRGSVIVELCDGKFRTVIWNDQDVDDDPTSIVPICDVGDKT